MTMWMVRAGRGNRLFEPFLEKGLSQARPAHPAPAATAGAGSRARYTASTTDAAMGGTVYRVDGLINDCGEYVQQGKRSQGWFDTSTLKEPYRIEGKKTMGLEQTYGGAGNRNLNEVPRLGRDNASSMTAGMILRLAFLVPLFGERGHEAFFVFWPRLPDRRP